MVIALTGYKQSGKDTVARYLVENYGYTKRAFADKLKDAFCAFFSITREELEAMKEDNNAVISLSPGKTIIKSKTDGLPIISSHMTVRHGLQRFGTEMGREVFGTDFWVNLAMENVTSKTVFSDCRFPNESEAIYHIQGYVVRIDRIGSDTEDTHASEVQLDSSLIDYTLHNDKDLEYLYQQVDAFMGHLRIGKCNGS